MDLYPPTIDELKSAQQTLRSGEGCLPVCETPLIKYSHNTLPDRDIFLKLENLTEVGSFKIRGAGFALSKISNTKICSCSAGNMGQGIAYQCSQLGKTCTIIVPDSAPQIKVDAMKNLGANVIPVTYDEWWQIMETENCEKYAPGHAFIHPCVDQNVLTGNGTVGLEIMSQMNGDLDYVFAPYGGGSLSCGTASALGSSAKVIAVEPETAAPLQESLRCGSAQQAPTFTPTFIDGAGGKAVFSRMWPVCSKVLFGSTTVSVEEAKKAVKILHQRMKVVAEGAGAIAVAAALSYPLPPKEDGTKHKVVAIVSGGHIDNSVLVDILSDPSV
eukprot:TRINITY_DN27471_c0_g1_i1.p1 TRINITY_DN27471_c0_g1~~TRINITY_DN27471_c0_g1_i1.p1  ORF type:complete len:342 (+),score=55.82 TRINITY_DN27471_c0_g1_i1:40-1026(+)